MALALLAGPLWPCMADAQTPATTALAPPTAPAPKSALSIPVRPDPAVRRGVLSNGLRYAVMQQAIPKGAVSIRLGFDVGSYEERDDERGAAHFLEHMAFNGTRNFPEGKLDQTFALIGVAGGRDINAHTGMFQTSYELDLPTAGPKNLDLGFQWLRDIADGMLLNNDAVARERGVILAEREARNNPSTIVQREITDFRSPELRSTQRDAIGTIDSVSAMTGERLRAFYTRWYRPQDAVVVVVGDLPLDQLEQRVKAAFTSWNPPGAPSAHQPLSPVNVARGLDVMVRQEPSLPTTLSTCRVLDPGPTGADDVARSRREIISDIWRLVLQRRLTALQSKTPPPFLGAVALSDDSSRDSSLTCVVSVAIGADWRPALKVTQAEMRRFIGQGPTEIELELALEEIRSVLRGGIGITASRSSPALAQGIMEKELVGDVFPSPREALRDYDLAVDDLSVDDVKASIAHDWSGAGPVIILVSPQAESADAVKAAWLAGQAGAAPDAYVDQAASSWAYSNFGTPGRVVRREVISDPGFVRLHLQNGVILNFKQTTNTKDIVSIRVRFGAGRREIANQNFFAASMGASLLKRGGLGKQSAQDLESVFRDTGWDVRLSVADDAFNLDGAATPGGLKRELELLAAFISDPGFRPTLDASLPTALDTMLRFYRTYPEFVMSQSLAQAIAPDSSYTLPPKEVVEALKSADFERLLKPALTQAPLEVTIVGDVDEKSAVELTARTFGALPARSPAPRRRTDTWFLRFPDHPLDTIRGVHEGPPDKAMVGVIWPLYVATHARRREEMALFLVARILNDALQVRIREELGMSYGPVASVSLSDNADQGSLSAMVETYPVDIDTVVGEVRKSADKLAAGDITPAALEAARKPILAGLDAAAATNDWWVAGLSGSSEDSQRPTDLAQQRAFVAALTLAEVRKAAATWLKAPPIVVVASPKSPAPAPAQEPTKGPALDPVK